MQPVEHISTFINKAPDAVYSFASNPLNLPKWAAGLAQSKIKKEGNCWVADAPFGKAKIVFADENPFFVMDHDVELENGVVVHNSMRVVPNGNGAEFIFTLIRQQDMTDKQFEEDKQAIERDLKTLKALLESR